MLNIFADMKGLLGDEQPLICLSKELLMKLSILLLLSAMVGCGGAVTRGWYVNGRPNNQVACFDHPAGLSSWRHCSDLGTDGKTACEAETLLTYRGAIVSEKTPVKVRVHTAAGYSAVQMDGRELFCPTVQVRK